MWQCNCDLICCNCHCISQFYDLIQYLTVSCESIFIFYYLTIWYHNCEFISSNSFFFSYFYLSCIFTQRWKQTSIWLQWAAIFTLRKNLGEKLLKRMWVRECCLCGSDHYTVYQNKRDFVTMYNGFSSFLCEMVVSNNEG